jgi:hypothetical protein
MILFILIVLTYEFLISLSRHYKRKKYYEMACARAKLTNRRLIVIGDPHHGAGQRCLGINYGSGDVCIDIQPCEICESDGVLARGDAAYVLSRFDADSGVIFVSCTLEYIKDIKTVIREIYRVSGGWENIFIVNIEPYSFASRFYYPSWLVGHTGPVNVIMSCPPTSQTIDFHRL